MAWRINRIEIENFKFFKECFDVLRPEGKHVAIFGENGAGKSSVFWSFYSHFQSAFKCREEAMKYYTAGHNHNLRNRFSRSTDYSGIKVYFQDGSGTIKSKETSSHNFYGDTKEGRDFMEATSITSDFLNYKFIGKLFDFNNSQDNDIFKIFQKEVFPLLTLSSGFVKLDGTASKSAKASEWWDYLSDYKNILPRNAKHPSTFNEGAPEYKKYKDLLKGFHALLNFELLVIVNRANEILKKDLGIQVKIGYEFPEFIFNERIGDSRKKTGCLKTPRLVLHAFIDNNKVKDNSKILHPKSFFNEAKITCMGLALRIAILERREPVDSACGVVFIDDLLISLDMSLRRKVVPLLLKCSDKWQVFFFTHDRHFFHLLKSGITNHQRDVKRENKLRKEKGDSEICIWDWVFYEFYADEMENEVPGPKVVKSESYLSKARAHLSQCNIPECVNDLRKGFEEQMKRLLPMNMLYSMPDADGARSMYDLNGMYQQFGKLIGEITHSSGAHSIQLDYPGLSDDRQLILNPFSHDDIETPFYRNEILKVMKDLENLSAINRTPLTTYEDLYHSHYLLKVSNTINGNHVSQTIEIIFESILYCWEIDSKKYFNNPLVKVIGSSDKGRIKFKNKNPDRRMGINIAYAALYNAVSLNASTAPPIEIALEKIS